MFLHDTTVAERSKLIKSRQKDSGVIKYVDGTRKVLIFEGKFFNYIENIEAMKIKLLEF